jgi:dTDP-4-dehydrorhamnose 3,5-epimerase
MLIKESKKFNGIFVIWLKSHKDKRGIFIRVYDDKIFKKYEMHKKWVQESHAFSAEKNTIRGLHFQFPPYTETKLVRVVGGESFEVFVDLRRESPTFGQWGSVILSSENKKMLYVPRGFALGMCALTDNVTVLYKIDNYYVPKSVGRIRWDDSELNIKWPIDGKPIISKKDQKATTFREFVKKYGGL